MQLFSPTAGKAEAIQSGQALFHLERHCGFTEPAVTAARPVARTLREAYAHARGRQERLTCSVGACFLYCLSILVAIF
jgi:hypothetical protein